LGFIFLVSQFLFIAIVAGLIAFVGTPFTLIVAQRVGLVALPNARKTHLVPTPLLGGAAMWAAFVISLLIFGQETQYQELIAIIVGGTVMAAVGLVDDRVGLGPVPKLVGELLAASILVIGGVQARLFHIWWLDAGLTLFWVIGICNAINFQDNMDGLAAGVSAVAAASFLLLAALNGQVLVASLAAALLGACLGYLVYNFQPAISFMGDTGALLLGFMLAVLGIKIDFPNINPLSTWMAPILVLGLPIFDTTLVTLSRIRRGVSIAQGGADHTSHRLARLGLSDRRVVLALYMSCIALGFFSVFLTSQTPLVANLLLAGLCAVGMFMLWLLDEVYRMPAVANTRSNLRITFIGGGDAMLSLLEGATSVSRAVALLVTPVDTQHEFPAARLRASLPLLAENTEAARMILNGSTAFADGGNIRTHAALAERTLKMLGRVVITVDEAGNLDEAAITAIRQTDLILIGGDLQENVLPTLKLEAVARALRRSKRARVLAHANPAAALKEIELAVGPGIITHIITGAVINSDSPLWQAGADLQNSEQVASALNQIWLRRTKMRGAPQPLSGNLYG
jgi:UDP-GlcNAc:undecaprenyl-phosphate/decaprenyl-phosphate GlcNAc-1-phosphate transferase